MGGDCANTFENNSQPVDTGEGQSCEASALSNSLWQELGATLSSYLGKGSGSGKVKDVDVLDFGVADIYDGTASTGADGGTDRSRAALEPRRFVPSERADAHPNYRGEVILRDVEPVEYTAEKGDTLDKIAGAHLGPNAGNDEIQAHAREIAELNGISKNDPIDKGDVFDLPGHTGDGGQITLDYHANKRTSWHDGREIMERSDGTGYERRPTDGGGYSKIHWGPEAEDCYEVVRTSEGRYLVADDAGGDAAEPPDHDDVRAERARLSDLAESLSDSADQYRIFQADMNRFEVRAARHQVASNEVAQTYHHLSRLLEGEGSPILDLQHRKGLAQQIIEQAVDPREIDQGIHNTCNVTTIETRMYTRNPSGAAKLVSEMALTGQFKTEDDSVIRLSSENLERHTQSTLNSAEDGERSYASQIFQVAAANVYWQRQEKDLQGNPVPKGDIRYDQEDAADGNQSGEYLRNHNVTPPAVLIDTDGAEAHDPNLYIPEYREIYNQIAGSDDEGFLLAHEKAIKSNQVSGFKSEDELRIRLIEMKDKLPAIIRVDSYNEPFLTDSGGGEAGGSDGWHVVTITDFDPETDRVSIDNQWGTDSDRTGERAVSVEDLYLASWKSTAQSHLDEMELSVDSRAADGTQDFYAELDLLRLQYDADVAAIKPLEASLPVATLFGGAAADELGASIARLKEETNDKYDTALAEQIVQIEKRWDSQESNGIVDAADLEKIDEKLRYMLAALPEERQAEVATLVQEGLADWSHATAPIDSVARAAERHWWWEQLQPEE